MGGQEAYLEPTHYSDDGYGRAADAANDDKRKKLDLLPRRHVGRRRPQYRVELRLRRRQIIQVGVAERF